MNYDVYEQEYHLARAARFDISEREWEVLNCLGLGYTNTRIGHELSITEETVKTHVKRLLSKLKADNRAHAAVVALRERIIK
jgi:NarL family two-component system response regulator LiaR